MSAGSRAIDGTLLATGRLSLDTVHGVFDAHVFHDLATERPVLAVMRGDPALPEPLLARVHSSCVTSEAYGACDCDCAEQLDAALAAVARAGRGVVFYVIQEGRGAGFASKARDRMLVQASRQRLTTFDAYAQMGLPPDQRSYGAVVAACRLLGVTAPLRLLTNNPEKCAALGDAGLLVSGTEPLALAPSPYNGHYLAAKSAAGHTVAGAGAAGPAELPEAVTSFVPHALAALPRFVRLASYLLPVRASRPSWFRLHLYLDAETGAERVVLTHAGRGEGDGSALVRVQHEALLERFPLRAPRWKRQWRAVVEEIVRHGAAAVLFVHAPGVAGTAEPDDAALALLATHVGSGPSRLLSDHDVAGVA